MLDRYEAEHMKKRKMHTHAVQESKKQHMSQLSHQPKATTPLPQMAKYACHFVQKEKKERKAKERKKRKEKTHVTCAKKVKERTTQMCCFLPFSVLFFFLSGSE